MAKPCLLRQYFATFCGHYKRFFVAKLDIFWGSTKPAAAFPPASPPSLHLILFYQLHMSTHGHKAIPVLLRFGWTKTVETPSVSRVFSSKMVEIHPYLVCFHQKRLRYTRISHVFTKNGWDTLVSRMFLSKTSDCHPPKREFTSGWGSYQIRNDAEWFQAEFYKQGTL